MDQDTGTGWIRTLEEGGIRILEKMMNQDTGVRMDQDIEGSMDQDTGVSIDHDTGVRMDQDTGVKIDHDTRARMDQALV